MAETGWADTPTTSGACAPGTDPGPAPPAAGVALVVAALGYGALTQGAFHARQYVVLVGLSGAALAVELHRARRTGRSLTDPPASAIWAASAVVLAAIALSALAQGSVAGVLPVVGWVLVVVAGLLVSSSSPDAARTTAAGLVVVATLVAGTGWVGVAWRVDPWGTPIAGLWRGGAVITYVNATAALSTMALLVVVGVGARRPTWWVRLVSWALIVGLVATMSRAGVAAALVGLVVVAVLAGWREVVRLLLTVAPGVVVALAGLVPGLVEGQPARPLVATLALLAGAALVVLSRSAVAGAALLAASLVAGAVVLAAVPGTTRDASEVADRVSRTRLVLESDDRGHEWRTAWERFERAPLWGRGLERRPYQWQGDDGRWYVVRYAHNEYLELLATQGLAGLAALVAAAALLAREWRRATPRRDPAGRALAAGAGAALVAFALHSAVDFLWHIPVLALAAAVLAGAGLARAQDPSTTPSRRVPT